MPGLNYEIKQKIACLSEEKGGCVKEINLSWNDNEQYDISHVSRPYKKGKSHAF